MADEYIRKQDAVDALKAQADTMRTWVERYAEQRIGILTAVNIVEDIKPADVVPYSIEPDGTLTVTVPKGTKVGRVLVQEDGTHCGGLYYAD